MLNKIIKFFISLFSFRKKPLELEKIYEDYSISSFDLEVINLINEYRFSNNLSILKLNNKLCSISYTHSKRMAFLEKASHDGFVTRANHFPKNKVGEVIGYGYSNPKSLVNAWKKSPSHNEALLNLNYIFIGLSFCNSNNDLRYVCCIFKN